MNPDATMESVRSPLEAQSFEEEDDDFSSDYEDDDEVRSRYYAFEAHLEKIGFEYLSCGSFRATYIRNQVVIKVPQNHDGVVDNVMEALAWKKYKSKATRLGSDLAPCRLLTNHCLMMVAVEQDIDHDDKPFWSSHIDQKQVGSYKGRVVAYDFALDITERYLWEKEHKLRSEFFHDTWLSRKPHLKKEKVLHP